MNSSTGTLRYLYIVEVSLSKEDEAIHNDQDMDIYTDGSLYDKATTGARVGCSAVWVKKSDEGSSSIKEVRAYKLSDYMTIYQAELVGVLAALSLYKKKGCSDSDIKRVHIHVDLQSVLKTISSGSRRTHPLRSIWSCIRQINAYLATAGRTTTIYFRWVKGHDGIFGNECADSYAKIAAALPAQNYYELSPSGKDLELPTAYIKNVAAAYSKQHRLNRWNAKIGSLSVVRCGLTLGPKQLNRITKTILRWSVKDRRIIIDLLSGHQPTRAYISRLSGSDLTHCRYCLIEGEAMALFFVCQDPYVVQIRRRILGAMYADQHTVTKEGSGYRTANRLIAGTSQDLWTAKNFLKVVSPSWVRSKRR